MLQESVFHLPGFSHALMLAAVQATCVALLAAVDFYLISGRQELQTARKRIRLVRDADKHGDGDSVLPCTAGANAVSTSPRDHTPSSSNPAEAINTFAGISPTTIAAAEEDALITSPAMAVSSTAYPTGAATSVPVAAVPAALDEVVDENPTLGRRTPLRYYALIAVLAIASSFLTNEATRSLSYPAQVVFKSAKLLVVMGLRAVLMRRTTAPLTFGDAMSALTVVMGLVCFTFATKDGKKSSKKSAGAAAAPSSTDAVVNDNGNGIAPAPAPTTVAVAMAVTAVAADAVVTAVTSGAGGGGSAAGSFTFGVIAIVLAVTCDGFLYVAEEHWCFKQFNSSNVEVVLYLNAFAALHGWVMLLLSGGVTSAFEWIVATPSFLGLVVAFSLCNFFGTSALLSIVRDFGSPTAVMVTSTRKVVTVMASFVLYPKPFTPLHFVGLVFVTVGVYLHEMNRKKK
jgi:adenosine 3'-phospho 5'-phosphosulfate transporter B3